MNYYNSNNGNDLVFQAGCYEASGNITGIFLNANIDLDSYYNDRGSPSYYN